MRDPVRFADVHNHLLPGVDDGSRSMDETLRHLQRFAAEGVVELVMTPHVAQPAAWDTGGLERRMREIATVFAEVQARCEGTDGYPLLHLGQELFAPNASHLRALLEHPEMGLGDTRFLLVEFGFAPLEQPEAVIELAHASGHRVLVAHPERYHFPSPAEGLKAVRRWLELGAFLQVNLGSLSGYYEHWTEGSRHLGWRMLDEGLAHVLASDDHGDGRSQLDQRHALRVLEERGGREQAKQLLSVNPIRLLRGEDPLHVAPLAVRSTLERTS
jgi:protein-tyrosine phosphatase